MTEYSPTGVAGRPTKYKELDLFPKCPLVSIKVPRGKQRVMRKLLKPFCKCVPAVMNALDVVEEETGAHHASSQQMLVPPYSISRDQLSSPAIAIILMLPEDGARSVQEVKAVFRGIPWQLHHAIHIEDKNSLNVIGSQEFHFMSRTFPLWSVITCQGSWRRLRIHLFVRRYNAMVEFYRLVTNSEMESQRHGFCVFPLNSSSCDNNGIYSMPSFSRDQNMAPCELALKQCAHVNPYPLSNVSLTLPVQNFESLRTLLQSRIQALSPRHYLVHDPDGNAVVLFDINSISSTESVHPAVPVHSRISSKWTQDKISAHTESIDSGHFSDFDIV